MRLYTTHLEGYLRKHLKVYLCYVITRDYLKDYLKGYLGRYLMAYLGYGITKDKLKNHIKSTCETS